jgi:hypothetical protein
MQNKRFLFSNECKYELVKTVARCPIEFLLYKSATQEKLNSSNVPWNIIIIFLSILMLLISISTNKIPEQIYIA